MQNNTEIDFYKIKNVATGRLSPDGISVFLLGALVFSGVMTSISYFAVDYSNNINNPTWENVVLLNIILFSIQILFSLFFFNQKNAFKFQRLQMSFFSLVGLKISIEYYQLFFLMCEDRHVSSLLMDIGFLIVAGGIAYLFVSIIRGIIKVKNGELKQGGKGLFYVKESKVFFFAPLIYITILLGLAVFNGIEDMELLFTLVLCVIFQYALSISLPEFLILTFCKFKYKSFIIPTPKDLYVKGAKKK